jgi:hypothetical protein
VVGLKDLNNNYPYMHENMKEFLYTMRSSIDIHPMTYVQRREVIKLRARGGR